MSVHVDFKTLEKHTWWPVENVSSIHRNVTLCRQLFIQVTLFVLMI